MLSRRAADPGRALRALAAEIPAALLAAALAAALDLYARGYPLRTDAALLALVDFAALAPPTAAIYAGLWLASRTVRAGRAVTGSPVLRVALAAAVVIALGPALRSAARAEDAAGSLPPFLLLVTAAAIGLALALDRALRRASPGRPIRIGVAPAAAAVAVLAAIVGLAPGRRPAGFELLRAPGPSPSPASAAAPNLLLIVLDTLRADRLGLYGNPRDASPWLDAFAARAHVFERAIAPTSYTLPSHATLFTGLYPAAHGADLAGGDRGVSLLELGRLDDFAEVAPLSASATTLAEIARAAGFETGAVCANTAYLYRAYGLDQGFDTWVDEPPIDARARPLGLALARALRLERFWRVARARKSNERYYLLASEVNALARAWLEPRRDRRFFLFLNYMDPHEPYIPVGRYRRLFPGAGEPYTVAGPAIRAGERPILPDEARVLAGAYDAEVRYLDDHLRALFDTLEAWGLLDRTIVVIAGDHGESFGEHANLGHAQSVYEPEVRVPLLVRRPGQVSGERVDRLAPLVDVPVTILDLLGLAKPDDLHGASLFDAGAGAGRPVVAALGRYQRDYAEEAVYRGDLKLIRRSTGEVELYDLRADPAERDDRAAASPGLAAELARELDRFRADVRPRFEARGAPADAETAERLRALGYGR